MYIFFTYVYNVRLAYYSVALSTILRVKIKVKVSGIRREKRIQTWKVIWICMYKDKPSVREKKKSVQRPSIIYNLSIIIISSFFTLDDKKIYPQFVVDIKESLSKIFRSNGKSIYPRDKMSNITIGEREIQK